MADEEKKKSGGAMYAWSKFKKEVNEWGQVTEWIMPGDKISQGDLGVSDEEWESLVETGAVREDEYPDVPADVPPAQAEKEEAQQEAVVEELKMQVKEEEEAPPKPEPTPNKPSS